MPKKWKAARVISIEDLSPSVKEIILDIEGEEIIDFKPGQFVTFDLPIGEKRLERWRSYSLVNPPNKSNRINLAVSYLEGGRASRFFFKELKTGDELVLKGPEGMFVLPSSLNKDLVMICTGTGVAPFKSMIDHVFNHDIPHKKIHLIYGSRTKADILYREEFEKLAKKHPEFKYSIALSREEFNGYQGYVHDIYRQHYGEKREDICFLLCGWQNMIDDANKYLKELGYLSDQILFELYG
ncbi:MAG: oxidoreductase [Saprospiraceae bacterium]|nr:oxidoreductase [Saprospiraceae bacterium]